MRLGVLAGYPLLSSPAKPVSLLPAPLLVSCGGPFGSSDVLRAPKQTRGPPVGPGQGRSCLSNVDECLAARQTEELGQDPIKTKVPAEK